MRSRSGRRAARAMRSCALLAGCLLACACASGKQHATAAPQSAPAAQGSLGEIEQMIARGRVAPVEASLTPLDAPLQEVDPQLYGPPRPPEPASASDAPHDSTLLASAPAPLAQSASPSALQDAPPASNAPSSLVPTENPYLAFGPRIVVHSNQRITKPYPVPPKKGRRLLELLSLYGDFPLHITLRAADSPLTSIEPAPTDPDSVAAVLLEDWDVELYQDLRLWPPDKVTTVPLADWLVITASPARLHEVEDFLDLFGAAVPQIEIEAKIVEISETDTLDLGIKRDGTSPILDFPTGTFIDSFSFNFPNSENANEALLTLGSVQDGTTFKAILEAVSTWENVAIDSQPKIAVREGGKAEIVNTQKIPYYGFSGITATGGYSASLNYEEVGVKLYIVPRVVGTDTVALNIDIEASQQTGTSVSFLTEQGGQLSTPIIAKRAARTVVYLQPGQAVILGGLTTLRDAEFERKVPLLGDIPILGYLFRSTNLRKEKTHVLFFIRPRILQGIELQRDF
jgi:type II secretory pathway component GspD/PulD (secretin)